MINIAQYLVESSCCLFVFYLFYVLVLRKETFFQWNRLYLLMTPFLSLIVPLIHIELYPEITTVNTAISSVILPIIEESNSFEQVVWQEEQGNWFNLSDLAFWVYLFGVVWMTYLLGKGLLRLFKQIKKGRIESVGKYKMVMDTPFPASSFFSYVFWNNKEMSDQEKVVWDHELVHVKQWHSLDVLLMEVWVILKWFNPLIYFYRNSLRITHEYIADEYVAKQTGSRHQYALMLTKVRPPSTVVATPFVNTFAQLLKKRLIMLSRRPSNQWKRTKYLLSIPLFSSLMLLFSFDLIEQMPQPIYQTLDKAENLLEKLGDQPLPFYSSEASPGMETRDLEADPEIVNEVYEAFPRLKTKLIPIERVEKETASLESKHTFFKKTRPDYSVKLSKFLESIMSRPSNPEPSHFSVRWLDKDCDCKPGQLPNYYHCENQGFTLKTFKRIAKEGGFKLYKEGVEVPYDELQVQSKRAFKIKKKLNQFDFQNVFNPKSKFWKVMSQGDVLKFTFRSGINDYFHFDVTILEKKGNTDYAYDFYLGDIWVPIDMTSNIGIKYVDPAVFDQITPETPIRFVKNGEVPVEVKKMDVVVDYVVGDQITTAFKASPSRSIPALGFVKDYKKVNFTLMSTNQNNYKIHIVAKKRKELTLPEHTHKITWGPLQTFSPWSQMVVSKDMAETLASEPIHFEYDGKRIPIKMVNKARLDIVIDKPTQENMAKLRQNQKEVCSVEDYQEDFSCITEKIMKAKRGDMISLGGIKTDQGHSFGLHIRIGSPEEIHDYNFFSKVESIKGLSLGQYVLNTKQNANHIKEIQYILSYRDLDGGFPAASINGTYYSGTEAQKEIEKLPLDKISYLLFSRKNSPNLLGVDNEVDGPLFRITTKEEPIIRKLTIPQGSIANDESIRILEDLGKSIYVVLDGEEKGMMSGKALKTLLTKISAEEVESLDVLKAEAAEKKYGYEGRNGAIVIKLK